MLILSYLRLCGQAVKTQPSHGCYPGSNPGRVTNATLSSVVFLRRDPPRVRVSPCDPHPLHARSARCNANPAESPMRRFQASFFLRRDPPRVRVSPCDPHPLHARSARCNANPAESPMRRFQASFFFAGILPEYAYRPAIRTHCTLARLAVMRIPQSHHNDAFQRRLFIPGSSPGTRIALRSAPAARSLGSL